MHLNKQYHCRPDPAQYQAYQSQQCHKAAFYKTGSTDSNSDDSKVEYCNENGLNNQNEETLSTLNLSMTKGQRSSVPHDPVRKRISDKTSLTLAGGKLKIVA